jgi:hypothetical protein
MAVLLYFLMSLFIVVAGFVLIGVTFYGWRQQSKQKKLNKEIPKQFS